MISTPKLSPEDVEEDLDLTQSEDEPDLTYHEYRAKVDSIKRQLEVNNKKGKESHSDFNEAIELAIELNLSILLARIQVAFQQRDYSLAHDLVLHTRRIATDIGLDTQVYRCLYWIGVLQERSDKPEDRARAVATLREAFPICYYDYVESRLLPLSLEKYLGQLNFEMTKANCSNEDRINACEDLYEWISDSRIRLGLSLSDRATAEMQPGGGINSRDTKVDNWLHETSFAPHSHPEDSAVIPEYHAIPGDLSLPPHTRADSKEGDTLLERERAESLESQNFTPISEFLEITRDPQKLDSFRKQQRARAENRRSSRLKHTTKSAQQSNSTTAAQPLGSSVVKIDEPSVRVKPWMPSESRRHRSSLYSKLMKDIKIEEESEVLLDANHKLELSVSDRGYAASKETLASTALLGGKSMGSAESDNLDASNMSRRSHSKADLEEKNDSAIRSDVPDTRVFSKSRTKPKAVSVGHQKEPKSESLQGYNTTRSRLDPKSTLSLDQGSFGPDLTTFSEEFHHDTITPSPATKSSEDLSTPVTTATLSSSKSSSRSARSIREVSMKSATGAEPDSPSALTTISTDAIEPSSSTLDREEVTENSSRRSNQNLVIKSTRSLANQQEGSNPRPVELSDALMPEKIDDRTEVTIGRRRSVDPKLPSPIVTTLNTSSDEVTRGIDSPYRRSSVTSSPLRRSTFPGDSP